MSAEPFSQAPHWKASQEAYLKAGPKAWEQAELPFRLTNHWGFAQQHAQLIFDHARVLGSTKIRILELGAGLGGFALAMAHALDDLISQTSAQMSWEYHCSDPVQSNLTKIKVHLAQHHFEHGSWKLKVYDLFDPPQESPRFDALILNYVWGQLPFDWVKADTKGHTFGVYSSDTGDEVFQEMTLPKWLSQPCRSHPEQILPDYSKALAALEAWLLRLKPRGFCMISDKGCVQNLGQFDFQKSTLYGPHHTFAVAFPLLKAWAKHTGWSTQSTTSCLLPLHTLLLTPESFRHLSQGFDQGFKRHHLGQSIAQCMQSGLNSSDALEAARFFKLAHELSPQDARPIYHLMATLIELQEFAEALVYWSLPRVDLLDEFDFDFQRGQIALFQSHPDIAAQYFGRSLHTRGPHEATWFNLGMAHMLQGHRAQGKAAFEAALSMDPDYDLAQMALESLDE